ncbi:MAG: CPBP family intramembrane metalloprotease [Muribaculaceae bacterium]|nr:CPBP family intramembrane metalloprotease [Muribaculaceae bacterium]
MNYGQTSRQPLLAPSLQGKLTTLLLSFFVMLITAGLLRSVCVHVFADSRDLFLAGSVLQSLLAFVCPAFITALLYSDSAARYVGCDARTSFRQYAGVVILMAIMTPAVDAVVEWNSSVSLPASMNGLADKFREWEETATQTTTMVLGDSSVWGLISGVIVVGCITGFAEEMFFRAGLQKALTSSGVRRDVAVCIAAFIFSAVHFQFYGFVPRFILGAFFGYLYWYTGSIWVASFAHALNNSVVVVAAWLVNRGYIPAGEGNSDQIIEWSPYLCLASAVITVIFIAFFWKRFFILKDYGKKSE